MGQELAYQSLLPEYLNQYYGNMLGRNQALLNALYPLAGKSQVGTTTASQGGSWLSTLGDLLSRTAGSTVAKGVQ